MQRSAHAIEVRCILSLATAFCRSVFSVCVFRIVRGSRERTPNNNGEKTHHRRKTPFDCVETSRTCQRCLKHLFLKLSDSSQRYRKNRADFPKAIWFSSVVCGVITQRPFPQTFLNTCISRVTLVSGEFY